MKLTKDEARILSFALSSIKEELSHTIPNHEKESTASLDSLEYRLNKFGIDKRRNGRTSMNSFHDMFKRFIIKPIDEKDIPEKKKYTINL